MRCRLETKLGPEIERLRTSSVSMLNSPNCPALEIGFPSGLRNLRRHGLNQINLQAVRVSESRESATSLCARWEKQNLSKTGHKPSRETTLSMELSYAFEIARDFPGRLMLLLEGHAQALEAVYLFRHVLGEISQDSFPGASHAQGEKNHPIREQRVVVTVPDLRQSLQFFEKLDYKQFTDTTSPTQHATERTLSASMQSHCKTAARVRSLQRPDSGAIKGEVVGRTADGFHFVQFPVSGRRRRKSPEVAVVPINCAYSTPLTGTPRVNLIRVVPPP